MIKKIKAFLRRQRIKHCKGHEWEFLAVSPYLWWGGFGGKFVKYRRGPLKSWREEYPYGGGWTRARLARCRFCGAICDEISFGEDWLAAKEDGTLERKLADGSIFARVGDYHD